MSSESGVTRSTGREREEWFELLDAWGAAGRGFRETAGWLTGEHGISRWWAQKLIVEYEQSRGLREAGARRDGTFSAGAGKTVAVPVERLFEAFVDPEVRERWLPGVALHERTTERGRSARFDRIDDGTRLAAVFAPKGAGRSEVAVEQERLPSADAAAEAKAYWRQRLSALKAELER